MAAFKLEALQKQLSESVPAVQLESANRQFSDLTAKYRDLLQREQLHSVQEHRIEETELVIKSITNEKWMFGPAVPLLGTPKGPLSSKNNL